MTELAPTDGRWFREVLGQYPTGVCAVTATEVDGPMAGFVVGSFTSVSLDPPLIAFFPDKGSTSWPRIQKSGKFCVNILGAEQEHVCRQFAAKGVDKFQGIDVRMSQNGSPIIEGVVAWIDCEIDQVYEAGDHYAVYGRVLDLNVENGSLPLLFFQGGYGRFSPLSMVASSGRSVPAERLRQVDLVRGEIESLASDCSSRCIATAVGEDSIVVLAGAGTGAPNSLPLSVGADLPYVLPNGNVLAAWRSGKAIDALLAAMPEDKPREESRKCLAAVRERGFSVGLINEAQREFASALHKLAQDPLSVERTGLRRLLAQLSYDPLDLTDEAKRAVRVVAVPVFDAKGEVVLALSVYGFPNPDAYGGTDALVGRALEASRRASTLLGGAAFGSGR